MGDRYDEWLGAVEDIALDAFCDASIRRIGKRPIAAFGNSDGDFQMLQWTTAGSGKRLGMLVHHDDAVREYAYDRDTAFGRLADGLDQCKAMGWGLISMKNDWKVVFAPGK